jgi:hypothetical protein
MELNLQNTKIESIQCLTTFDNKSLIQKTLELRKVFQMLIMEK